MITETYDMDIVNQVFQHPDIWKHIAPADIEPFDVPIMANCIYHLVNDGDGVIVYHWFRDGLKIHPSILPEKRGKMAYQAVEDSIQMVIDQCARTIYCEIDADLKHVIRFAKALKFRVIETGDRILLVRRKLDG